MWQRAGIHPDRLLLPLWEERRLIRRARAEARSVWHDVLAHQPRFVFADTDVTDAALAALGRIVRNSAPWLAAEGLALSRAIERWGPKHLVLATDQHRIGRLAVNAALGTGIGTVVLQHGLPQTPIGYLPLVADTIHVWSPGIREWFVNHGADPDRIVTSGNPRMDELAAMDQSVARREIDMNFPPSSPEPVVRLLVPLSPMGTDADLAVVRTTIDAMRSEPRLRCVIKLHPGSGGTEPITSALAAATDLGSRMIQMRSTPLPALLLWADVTFLFRSTVGLESMAAGVPVVVADTGRPSMADDELRALDLPRAVDGESLMARLRSLATPAGRAAFVGDREVAIERLVGPRDGRCALRIAESLGKTSNEPRRRENSGTSGGAASR
jgi:hypothetical protein